MQPYFFPYIGYFQLMANVDQFVIYDNIKFTKKGWINRNRILVNGKDDFISLPLKKDSDYLNVNQRYIADSFETDRLKLKRKIEGAYRKAPFFREIFSLVSDIIDCEDRNLFSYIFNSIKVLNNYLNIDVPIIKSSNLDIDIERFEGQDKVLKICQSLKASTYINPIGGKQLYEREAFKEISTELLFIKSLDFEYQQFGNEFIPWLSIIDVLMFNEKDKVQDALNNGFIYETN